jgi:hypothetical protein
VADIDERFAAYVRDRGEHHLRVAVLLTGDWHAAEDLVQASLVKLYRVWPGIAAAAASVTAAALTMGSAPSALAVVTSALTRTLTQSYHLSEQYGYYHIVNGQIRSLHHDACTTETDPVRHMLATSCPSGIVSREVGGYRYIYSPGPVAGHRGKHWLRIPAASIVNLPSTGGFTTATPQQMLAEIKKAATVTVAGPASGPGWTGTRYAFSATLTHVLTFSDFGAPVTVTPPPADQTFSGP